MIVVVFADLFGRDTAVVAFVRSRFFIVEGRGGIFILTLPAVAVPPDQQKNDSGENNNSSSNIADDASC